MKIEVTITASGNTEKAKEILTKVVKDIRAGLFQIEASGDDVKVKATVKVIEDK